MKDLSSFLYTRLDLMSPCLICGATTIMITYLHVHTDNTITISYECTLCGDKDEIRVADFQEFMMYVDNTKTVIEEPKCDCGGHVVGAHSDWCSVNTNKESW